MKLSATEEKLMLIIWKLEKATTREVLSELPDPKPNLANVATFLNQLKKNGYLSAIQVSRQYVFELKLSFDDYRKMKLSDMLLDFFNGDKKAFKDFISKI